MAPLKKFKPYKKIFGSNGSPEDRSIEENSSKMSNALDNNARNVQNKPRRLKQQMTHKLSSSADEENNTKENQHVDGECLIVLDSNDNVKSTNIGPGCSKSLTSTLCGSENFTKSPTKRPLSPTPTMKVRRSKRLKQIGRTIKGGVVFVPEQRHDEICRRSQFVDLSADKSQSNQNSPLQSWNTSVCNDTITIDDSIIVGETTRPKRNLNSDVVIIEDEDCARETVNIGKVKNSSSQDSIIVDLVQISAPMEEVVVCNQVQRKRNRESSLSNDSVYLLPDIIPVSRKTKHKTDGLGLRTFTKKKKNVKASPALKKLKKKKRRLLHKLNKLSFSPSKEQDSEANMSLAGPSTMPVEPTASTSTAASNVVFRRTHELDNNVPFFQWNVPPPPYNLPVTSAPRPQLNDNIYNPGSSGVRTGLRPIMIDGSNVACEYKKNMTLRPIMFNAKGIEVMVDYFKLRGHTRIYVFIPSFRAFHANTLHPEILEKLHKEGIVIYTPSRIVNGRREVSYDDRYVVQMATELGGVIVSNDRYRDLMQENVEWKRTIEQRLLMFNFVGEMLMFPKDPHGLMGPDLGTMLKF